MKKVLEKGNKTLPHEIVYVMKCWTCGCKFTYTIKDIKCLCYEERGIECPQCKYWCSVPLFKRKHKGE